MHLKYIKILNKNLLFILKKIFEIGLNFTVLNFKSIQFQFKKKNTGFFSSNLATKPT